MARGIGTKQQAIVAYLHRYSDRTISELAAQLNYGDERAFRDRVTKNQLDTIRRAIRGLVKRKIVQCRGYQTDNGERIWYLSPRATAARSARPRRKALAA